MSEKEMKALLVKRIELLKKTICSLKEAMVTSTLELEKARKDLDKLKKKKRG